MFVRRNLRCWLKPTLKRKISSHHIDQIKSILGSENLFSTNPNVLHLHGADVVGHKPLPPDIVVYPENIDQISSIAKLCNQNKIPIIPFGAGTSLEGFKCEKLTFR
jgi:FAD/FMN-containing dehydrogenase